MVKRWIMANDNCTFTAKNNGCPLRVLTDCKSCGWDREEDRRRRALKLRKDPETGLYHKFLRK